MEKCFGYDRISQKNEVAELREMLEALRSENRDLCEKLGQEVNGDGIPSLEVTYRS